MMDQFKQKYLEDRINKIKICRKCKINKINTHLTPCGCHFCFTCVEKMNSICYSCNLKITTTCVCIKN